VTPSAALIEEPAIASTQSRLEAIPSAFRLRPMMRQGTASSIPETWTRFTTLEDARKAIKGMYQDDRVLRAFIVTDEAPPQFVEWVER
jgi:hypothetical protein